MSVEANVHLNSDATIEIEVGRASDVGVGTVTQENNV